MPKAARSRVVPLTVTKKKTKEFKSKNIEEVRSLLDRHKSVFVFSFDNLSTARMQKVREDWTGSRFFFGKNKVVKVAFGRNPSEEYKDGITELGKRLKGHRGLLFTDHSKDEVLKYFNTFESPGFAKTGFVATDTIVLEPGPLEQFSFSMEKRLRELGLDVTLKKGVIELLQQYTVCTEGQPLTSEAARVLELMGIQMAHFRINVEGVWSEKTGFVDLIHPTKKSTKKKTRTVVSHGQRVTRSRAKSLASDTASQPDEIAEDAMEEEFELN